MLNEGQGSAWAVCEGERRAPGVRIVMRMLRLPDALLLGGALGFILKADLSNDSHRIEVL